MTSQSVCDPISTRGRFKAIGGIDRLPADSSRADCGRLEICVVCEDMGRSITLREGVRQSSRRGFRQRVTRAQEEAHGVSPLAYSLFPTVSPRLAPVAPLGCCLKASIPARCSECAGSQGWRYQWSWMRCGGRVLASSGTPCLESLRIQPQRCRISGCQNVSEPFRMTLAARGPSSSWEAYC
jgi:hypothetical protein